VRVTEKSQGELGEVFAVCSARPHDRSNPEKRERERERERAVDDAPRFSVSLLPLGMREKLFIAVDFLHNLG
jgi:hypothetical protein